MLGVTGEVDQQAYGAAVVANHNVRVAFVVNVAEGCAAAHLGQRERLPRLLGDIPESAVTEIGNQLLGLVELARHAVEVDEIKAARLGRV